MSFIKKDTLRTLEQEVQEYWESEKIFEEDAPSDGRVGSVGEKYFATFPFPYMNGRLHLGHTFTISKVLLDVIVFEHVTIIKLSQKLVATVILV